MKHKNLYDYFLDSNCLGWVNKDFSDSNESIIWQPSNDLGLMGEDLERIKINKNCKEVEICNGYYFLILNFKKLKK